MPLSISGNLIKSLFKARNSQSKAALYERPERPSVASLSRLSTCLWYAFACLPLCPYIKNLFALCSSVMPALAKRL